MSSAFICFLAFYVPPNPTVVCLAWLGFSVYCEKACLWLVNLINFNAVDLKFQSETLSNHFV